MATLLGPNLKQLRAWRGLSQEETARALEAKRSSYSGYENRTAEPCLDLLLSMAVYFRVSVDVLLCTDLTTWTKTEYAQHARAQLYEQTEG